MTERLYFLDPTRIEFTAQVVERTAWEGQPAVVLDRSAFYPTGGGQPHDVGFLGGVAVLDVVEREADGAVIHVLAGPLRDERVEGRVDWERRFDLMQQHTGQHILSAAFVQVLGANTVGFHLSADYATIDVDRAPLSNEQLQQIEAAANAVVFEDRRITARFVADEEAALLPLRKPLAHSGPVRIVEVHGFDCSACGGIHVQATGELGLIKITRSERRGNDTRIEFLCGWRALQDYGRKNELLLNLARDFTVGHWEIGELVHRLAADLKDARQELRRARDALLDMEATAMWHQAEKQQKVRVIKANLPERTPEDLKHLAQRLVVHPATVALLASRVEGGGKASLTFARSPDVVVHMGHLVRLACQVMGGGGGGRAEFAQGGGPQGERLPAALEIASSALEASLKGD